MTWVNSSGDAPARGDETAAPAARLRDLQRELEKFTAEVDHRLASFSDELRLIRQDPRLVHGMPAATPPRDPAEASSFAAEVADAGREAARPAPDVSVEPLAEPDHATDVVAAPAPEPPVSAADEEPAPEPELLSELPSEPLIRSGEPSAPALAHQPPSEALTWSAEPEPAAQPEQEPEPWVPDDEAGSPVSSGDLGAGGDAEGMPGDGIAAVEDMTGVPEPAAVTELLVPPESLAEPEPLLPSAPELEGEPAGLAPALQSTVDHVLSAATPSVPARDAVPDHDVVLEEAPPEPLSPEEQLDRLLAEEFASYKASAPVRSSPEPTAPYAAEGSAADEEDASETYQPAQPYGTDGGTDDFFANRGR